MNDGNPGVNSTGTLNLLRKCFPIMEWGAKYTRQTFVNDLIVGVVVTMMLIPQSLAYAQLPVSHRKWGCMPR